MSELYYLLGVVVSADREGVVVTRNVTSSHWLPQWDLSHAIYFIATTLTTIGGYLCLPVCLSVCLSRRTAWLNGKIGSGETPSILVSRRTVKARGLIVGGRGVIGLVSREERPSPSPVWGYGGFVSGKLSKYEVQNPNLQPILCIVTDIKSFVLADD